VRGLDAEAWTQGTTGWECELRGFVGEVIRKKVQGGGQPKGGGENEGWFWIDESEEPKKKKQGKDAHGGRRFWGGEGRGTCVVALLKASQGETKSTGGFLWTNGGRIDPFLSKLWGAINGVGNQRWGG